MEPNDYFKKITSELDPSKKGEVYKFSPYSLSEFLEKDFGAFEFLYQREGGEEEGSILESNSLVIISGKEGSGKTFIATEMALALASGRRLFGVHSPFRLPNNEKRKILIIEEEMTAKSFKNRLKLFPIEKDADIRISVDSNFKIDTNDHFVQLVDYLKENKINCVIIDSFVAVNQLENENSATEVHKVMQRLKALREFGLIIFLHHHRKPGQFEKSSGTIRGSTNIAAAVDISLVISTDPMENCIIIEQEKNRNAPKIRPFRVRIEKGDDNLVRVNYVSDFDAMGSSRDVAYVKIPQWFMAEGTWLSKDELCARGESELKVKKGSIEEALRSLVNSKRLQTKKGKDLGKFGNESRKSFYALFSEDDQSDIYDAPLVKVNEEDKGPIVEMPEKKEGDFFDHKEEIQKLLDSND